jgi:hypothetical protein
MFHFKQSLLNPMIQDIQMYDAEHFILGHESICDREEMDVFWRELTISSRAVTSTPLEQAKASFEKGTAAGA